MAYQNHFNKKKPIFKNNRYVFIRLIFFRYETLQRTET